MIEKQFTPSVPLFFRASREIFHSTKFAVFHYGCFIGLPILLFIYFVMTGKGATHELALGLPAWAFLVLCFVYVFVLMPALQYWG